MKEKLKKIWSPYELFTSKCWPFLYNIKIVRKKKWKFNAKKLAWPNGISNVMKSMSSTSEGENLVKLVKKQMNLILNKPSCQNN